jgi:predicted ATPase
VGETSGLFDSIQIKNFGEGAAAPFEVDIVLDGKEFSLDNVGYGVSQSLPVFVEIIARKKGTWFAIQQPEVHLHPRAQAALGDVIFETALKERKRFLIETHSDFTIDRFRMNYQGKANNVPDGQIIFFERKNKRNIATPIKIGSEGQLPVEQPEGYRNFFINEGLRLLGY